MLKFPKFIYISGSSQETLLRSYLESRKKHSEAFDFFKDRIIEAATKDGQIPESGIAVTSITLQNIGWNPTKFAYEGDLVLHPCMRILTFQHQPDPEETPGLNHNERVALVAVIDTERPDLFPFRLVIPQYFLQRNGYFHPQLNLAVIMRDSRINGEK